MNLFPAAMIVLVPFQNPEPELAMAEEETSKREAPSSSAVSQSKKVKIPPTVGDLQPVGEFLI